ncbi:hypothetical protein VNI00_005352 [Paramarasmius palmivorus]|uniref:F-box protein n=1 Tax=Paramarasmius palmivorus TaxID=297713 RepID=A0AAW0DES3_9AGAR
MSPNLPVEIFREIVRHVLGSKETSDVIGFSSKPSWCRISSLVYSSKLLRALSLERWFQTLYISTPGDIIDGSLVFPEIKKSWTRELHCILHETESSQMERWEIEGFKRLNKIRFDWIKPMPNDQSFTSTWFQSTIPMTELEIRGMEWPSPKVVSSIARTFPHLEILRLQQDTVWCGLCYLCCVPGFQEPGPSSITYKGGLGLPFHYSQALAPLSRLQVVIITVRDNGRGETELRNEAGKNDNIWSGECDECMALMYSDSDYRERSTANKKKAVEKSEERPSSLEVVEWRFYSVPTFSYDDQPTPTPFD